MEPESKRCKMENHCRMVVEEESEEEEDNRAQIQYPTGRGAITLKREDISRLEPARFLNDQLIDLVLKWQRDTITPPEILEDIVLCDSMAYAQLVSGVNRTQLQGCQILQQNAARVCSWYAKRGELLRNIVLIPVCEDAHWLLVVVINHQEEAVSEILVFDSVAAIKRHHLGQVIGCLFNTAFAHDRQFQVVEVKVTQQANGFDCGIHVLHNATELLRCLSENRGPSLAYIEAGLARPTLERSQVQALLALIKGETTAPTAVAAPPVTTAQPPHPVKTLHSGEQWEVEELLILRNGKKKTWEVTQETLDMILHTAQETRPTLKLCRQRRRVFIKKWGETSCRFSIDCAKGTCLVIGH